MCFAFIKKRLFNLHKYWISSTSFPVSYISNLAVLSSSENREMRPILSSTPDWANLDKTSCFNKTETIKIPAFNHFCNTPSKQS